MVLLLCNEGCTMSRKKETRARLTLRHNIIKRLRAPPWGEAPVPLGHPAAGGPGDRDTLANVLQQRCNRRWYFVLTEKISPFTRGTRRHEATAWYGMWGPSRRRRKRFFLGVFPRGGVGKVLVYLPLNGNGTGRWGVHAFLMGRDGTRL